jgi:hypothetical protein
MKESPVMSAYADEQDYLTAERENKLKLMFKLTDWLYDEGYEIIPFINEGVPDYKLEKIMS